MINVCEVLLVGHMRTSLFQWLASSAVMSPLVTASWREAIEEKSPFLKQNAPLPPCCGRLRYIQAPPLLTVLKTLLWCEAQRLQRSSIQRRLHHGDPSHPARGPFAPLPSGERLRSVKLQPAATPRWSEELHTSLDALSSCCLPFPTQSLKVVVYQIVGLVSLWFIHCL